MLTVLRSCIRLSRTVFFAACVICSGSAQVNTASLTGVVTDQSHAIVPEANVSAVNVATNTTYATRTDVSGHYFSFATSLLANARTWRSVGRC